MMTGLMDALFTEDEYRSALKRFLEICDAPENSPEADELEHLIIIMEIYELENEIETEDI
jgi:hypothetical protein